MAAATARQKSTSNPDHLPLASASAKPSRPELTPQISFQRDLTVSKVPAAQAPAPANRHAREVASPTVARTFLIVASPELLKAPLPVEPERACQPEPGRRGR